MVKYNFNKDDESKEESEEEYSEDPERSKIRKPPAYKDMTDAQYIKCTNREKFVMLGRGDKHSAVEFLRSKEAYFKRTYSDEEKKSMHRAILWDGYSRLSHDDITTLREVLGTLTPVTRNGSNTQYSETEYTYKPPQSPTEWMSELKYSTFVRFRKVMNNQRFKETILDNLDDYGKDCLCDVIEYQLITKYVMPFQEMEGFVQEDMIWINNI